jgi:hypothetical protein
MEPAFTAKSVLFQPRYARVKFGGLCSGEHVNQPKLSEFFTLSKLMIWQGLEKAALTILARVLHLF